MNHNHSKQILGCWC